MVGGVAYEVTTDEVVGGLREGHHCCELLIEVVWDGLERYHTFPQNDASLLNSENSVHVPRNVELMQTFDIGVLAILYVCLRFSELFGKFDT